MPVLLQVNFTMSEDTTLAELLQLNLHKFEDEVSGIVDKAIKESGMEKVNGAQFLPCSAESPAPTWLCGCCCSCPCSGAAGEPVLRRRCPSRLSAGAGTWHRGVQLISHTRLQVLNSLDTTWATMEFEHETHARTGIMLLKSDEELIETLEDHQTQLQNMMTSKYLAFFLQEVSSWQQKLSTTDSVINIWFELQRTWSHLESIFIGSEDIRSQLPEESKLFDTIDEEFKVRSPSPPGPLIAHSQFR